MSEDHERFMAECLAAARAGEAMGNSPVGSVIVRNGEVLAIGHNTVNSETNPLNHAETVVIQAACREVGSTDLAGATLYSSMEPCPMCCWAAHVAGINRIVLGGRHARVGSTHVGDYSIERLMELTNREMELVTGILEEECENLRREWNEKAVRSPAVSS